MTHRSQAGFVLVGGASRRMGRDKAMLPLDGKPMVDQIATRVRDAAGSVTLIGPVQKYLDLGFPIVADHVENCGPLGGLLTALRITNSDWNVLVACDMPDVTDAFLSQLLFAAQTSDGDCVVPEVNGAANPLCAVYHRRLLNAAEAAVTRKLFKMQDFISSLVTLRYPVPDPRVLNNVNTFAEWSTR